MIAVVSNLSSIGFEFADDAAFAAAMQRLAGETFERLGCDPGDYGIWRSRTSAEIWFHIVGDRDASGVLSDREVVGLSPFFEGVSDVSVEIVETVIRPGDSDFEGAFLAWVNPDETTGLGAHQIVFDAVDFAAHCDRPMPFVAQAKLTGFAREIRLLEGAEAKAAGAMSSARGFMPLGLFGDRDPHADGPMQAPSSHALLTGTIREASKLVNEETGGTFHWLLVETSDAVFDIVADPLIVPAGMVPGAMVEVGCWFFGRILG